MYILSLGKMIYGQGMYHVFETTARLIDWRLGKNMPWHAEFKADLTASLPVAEDPLKSAAKMGPSSPN